MVLTTYDADPALSLLGLSPSSANNPACKQAVSFTHFPTNVIPVTGMLQGEKMRLPVCNSLTVYKLTMSETVWPALIVINLFCNIKL